MLEGDPGRREHNLSWLWFSFTCW